MAAEAELLQQILFQETSIKMQYAITVDEQAETVKHSLKTRLLHLRRRQKGAKCDASDALKSSKSVILYAKSACTPFLEYANSMQVKVAQEAQSVKH